MIQIFAFVDVFSLVDMVEELESIFLWAAG
jgi:hypothetical protein